MSTFSYGLAYPEGKANPCQHCFLLVPGFI